jgi:hypothetical protein
MLSSRASKIMALSAGAGVFAAPLVFVAPAAFAATDCGTGTEVSAGICEQAFTTAGAFTFDAPSGIAKVSAIVVGAGGGAGGYDTAGAYGGGGGDVVFIDSADASSAIAVTVGAGGAIAVSPGAAQDGGDSTFGSTVATGGSGATFDGGGASGSGDAGFNIDIFLGSGGGAGGAATDCVGGAGLTGSASAPGSALFPVTAGEAVFGAGGSCSDVAIGSFTGTAGSGGSVSGDFAAPTAEAGEDGAVIVRWAASLPDTGLNVQPWMIGTGVALAAAGAVFASGMLRTRRRGRHSA